MCRLCCKHDSKRGVLLYCITTSLVTSMPHHQPCQVAISSTSSTLPHTLLLILPFTVVRKWSSDIPLLLNFSCFQDEEKSLKLKASLDYDICNLAPFKWHSCPIGDFMRLALLLMLTLSWS